MYMTHKKRILITGAGGFIGSHIAKALYGQGYFVRAANLNWSGYMEEPYYSEKMTVDLRNLADCLEVTRGIDWVYHFSADMGGIGYISKIGADIVYNNSIINLLMLRACLENGVRRIFFASSACVYPEHLQNDVHQRGLREEDVYPASPDTFYGWEKLYAEKMYEAFAKDHGIEVRIARYHNIYGPRGTYQGGREKAPAALCRKIALAPNPGKIEVWGDGLQTRSYCFIDDCVRGTLALMESNVSEPINIGSDRLVAVNELVDMIASIAGKNIELVHDLSAPQGVRGRNADLTRARLILGWEPQVSLEDGLQRTYEWIHAQVNKECTVVTKK